jgi:hypothetical protein
MDAKKHRTYMHNIFLHSVRYIRRRTHEVSEDYRYDLVDYWRS